MIIDTATGIIGKEDSRLVNPDTLFPVFSATKGVTTGMMHWLADKVYIFQLYIFSSHEGICMGSCHTSKY